jgi:5-methylcytosine-specific restriction protein A
MFWNKIRYATRSPKWKTIRKYFLKDHPACEACGSTQNLEVHHIEPVHINPDRELDPTNLITLCDKYCHLAIGHLMNYKSFNKNVIEDAEKFLTKIKNRP